MTRSSHPVDAIRRAQRAMRKTAIRRELSAVAEGKSERMPPDAVESQYDAAGAVEQITAGLREGSLALQLLQVAFKNSNVADRAIERLTLENVHERVASTRLIGSMRTYEATPWLAPLLAARDRAVADAAARALGRIGGGGSATALLRAMRRRGLDRRLISELARGAPDLFVEAALSEPGRSPLRPGLAIAAGLRRRRTAISPLVVLLERGSRKERVISCRALGWIGAPAAIPVLVAALGDREWEIRMSAAKALGALRAGSSRWALERLCSDRNPRVRTAAHQAIRRLSDGA